MNSCDQSNRYDGHNKWSNWSMNSAKRGPRATDYGSAFVFALSAIMMVGLVF